MKIIFDVLHLYYLPQYLPVYRQLILANTGEATFVFYHGIHDDIIKTIIAPVSKAESKIRRLTFNLPTYFDLNFIFLLSTADMVYSLAELDTRRY